MRMKEELPGFFDSILWSYSLSRIDPHKDIRVIIVQTINYGEWRHWQWVLGVYGRAQVKKIIESIPESEFRPGALVLAKLLFGIRKMKYESRSAYIQYQKNLAKA